MRTLNWFLIGLVLGCWLGGGFGIAWWFYRFQWYRRMIGGAWVREDGAWLRAMNYIPEGSAGDVEVWPRP